MGNKRFDKRLFWLAPYLFIAIVIFTIVYFSNYNYNKTFYEQTNVLNDYIKDNVSNRISDVFKKFYFLSAQVLNAEDAKVIDDINDKIDYYKSEKTRETVVKLSNEQNLLGMFELVYIYASKDDIIISSTGIFESRFFYDTYFKSKFESYDKWKSILMTQSIEQKFESYEDTIHYFIRLNKLYNLPLKNENIMLGTYMKKDNMFAEIPSVEWINCCNIYIYDLNMNLVLSDQRVQLDGIPENPTIMELAGNNQKYDIVESVITVNSWEYKILIVFEKALSVQSVKGTQMVSLISILINIILFSIFLLYLYKTQYSPISNIAELLDVEEVKSNYSFLEKNIKTLLRNNERLQESYTKQKNSLKDVLLNKFLTNDITNELFVLLGNCDIKFKYDYFLVVASNLYTDENLPSNEEEIISGAFVKMLKETLLDKSREPFITVADNRYVCIYNFQDMDKSELRVIGQKIAYGCNLLSNKFDFVLSVAVSDIHKGYNGISEAYLEASEVISQSNLFDRSKVFLYTDLQKRKNRYFSLKDENEILDFIKAGNYPGVEGKIKNIISNAMKECVKIPQSLSIGLIYTLTKAAQYVSGDEQTEETGAIYNLKNADNISLWTEAILNCANRLCEDALKSIQLQNSDFIEVVLDYIHGNYADPDLSMDKISRQVFYSTIHINNVFKKAYGVTPSAYLSSHRMNMAKGLIKKGEIIADAAKKAGFSNIRTFNRAFKKETNMTPMEYRNHALQNPEE